MDRYIGHLRFWGMNRARRGRVTLIYVDYCLGFWGHMYLQLCSNTLGLQLGFGAGKGGAYQIAILFVLNDYLLNHDLVPQKWIIGSPVNVQMISVPSSTQNTVILKCAAQSN